MTVCRGKCSAYTQEGRPNVVAYPPLPLSGNQLLFASTGVAQAPASSAGWRSDQPRPPVGRDKNEKPQGFTDLLPDWLGYSFLYGVSALPVIIGILVVAVLFFNSLK